MTLHRVDPREACLLTMGSILRTFPPPAQITPLWLTVTCCLQRWHSHFAIISLLHFYYFIFFWSFLFSSFSFWLSWKWSKHFPTRLVRFVWSGDGFLALFMLLLNVVTHLLCCESPACPLSLSSTIFSFLFCPFVCVLYSSCSGFHFSHFCLFDRGHMAKYSSVVSTFTLNFKRIVSFLVLEMTLPLGPFNAVLIGSNFLARVCHMRASKSFFGRLIYCALVVYCTWPL